MSVVTDSGLQSAQRNPLQGGWLVLARITWVIFAILGLATFGAAISFRFHELVNLPPETNAELIRLGLSPSFRAFYFIIFELLVMLGFFFTSAVLFWRKSEDRLVIFVSLALITLGVTITSSLSSPLDALVAAHPSFFFLVGFMRAFGYAYSLIIFYLFPDGRFVPSWSRVVVILIGVWGLTWLPFRNTLLNPNTWPFLITMLVFLGLFGISLYAQIYRYRHVSTPPQKQQTKWIVFGLALRIPGYFLTLLPPFILPALNQPGLSRLLYEFIALPLSTFFIILGPVTIGIAILRHHLWDIDLIINRTLVYSALSAIVIGMYIAIVLLVGSLFQVDNNPFVSVFATASVAVFFQPARGRLQRGVNRLMYGERDDPYAVISRLGQRLEIALSPEAVLPSIVETVAQALKLPYAAIALKKNGQPDKFEIFAIYGQSGRDVIQLPLVHQGEVLGQLLLSPRTPGEVFNPADQRLLSDFARHVGVAVHATRLTLDLQRSREQIITAREEERRRLRRDLHDGLGPTLATLAFKIDAILNFLTFDTATSPEPNVEDARALLKELKSQMQTAIGDIRRLVYNLRPPVLDQLGLISAIRSQAAEHQLANGLQVLIEAPERLPVLPAAVEVAAYRIAAEALTNVSRHAQAKTCQIRFTLDSALQIEIVDDGIGIQPDRRAGVGMNSMRERAIELGGIFRVEAMPGKGTRVLAQLPLQLTTAD